jgi:hypothetical protein
VIGSELEAIVVRLVEEVILEGTGRRKNHRTRSARDVAPSLSGGSDGAMLLTGLLGFRSLLM